MVNKLPHPLPLPQPSFAILQNLQCLGDVFDSPKRSLHRFHGSFYASKDQPRPPRDSKEGRKVQLTVLDTVETFDSGVTVRDDG